MAEQSKIEWTDHTFNPWEGCQKVAPECDNCYAESRDQRFTGGVHWGPKAPRRRTSAQNWNKPRRWNAQADAFHATHGRRQRVFCASLADVFDNAVDPAWRDDLWALIRECDQIDWLLLTKRPQNIAKMLPPHWGRGWPHVWLGTSAGTQKTADHNIPHLLAVPAAVRFISAEPLLGPVDLEPWLAWPDGGGELPDGCPFGCAGCEIEIGPRCQCPRDRSHYHIVEGPRDSTGCPEYLHAERVTLDWIIVGGESGKNARPMHPDWARKLRDQCNAARVPLFFKQWGEWIPWEMRTAPMWQAQNCRWEDANTLFPSDMDNDPRWDDGLNEYKPGVTDHCAFERIGKGAAGRLLDGREWNEFPQ